jgi:hypothetical protein
MWDCINMKPLQIQLIVLYILHEEVKMLSGKKYFNQLHKIYSHCISCIARELAAFCIPRTLCRLYLFI